MKKPDSPVSILILVCILLTACAPTVQAASGAPATIPAKTATLLPTIIDSSPATIAPTGTTAVLPSPTPFLDSPAVGKVLKVFPLPVNPDRDAVNAFVSLWLPDDTTGIVTRWDPVSGKVLASIKVGDPAKTPYGDPVAVVATTDSIWVTAVAKHAIERIDPATNQVAASIPLGQVKGQDFITNVMVGDDNNMWVWDYDRQITLRIDLKKKQVAATYQNFLPAAVENGSLWAYDAQHSDEASNLLRIDPATDQIIATIPLDKVNPLGASAKNSLWFGHGQDLVRIDPATNQVIASIDLGASSWGSLMIGDNLWAVASSPSGGPPACYDLKQDFIARIDLNTNSIIGKIGLVCPGNIMQFGNDIWIFTGVTTSYIISQGMLIQPGN
jgi:hypothetical protein